MNNPTPVHDMMPVVACGGQIVLICPVCESTQVWPTSVASNPGGACQGRAKVDHEGVHIDRTQPPPATGFVVRVGFGCSNGHVFAFDFINGFGQTLVSRGTATLPAGLAVPPPICSR
jgi:hypothetical protein